ncbi:EFR1 family ferrodoxin [Chloroflexota bacterium]
MYTIIYFSPTGNVLHLANMLATRLEIHKDKLLPLEFVEPDQLTNDKHLVLLYPVHAFSAPRTVNRFVKRLPPGLYGDVSLIGVGCTTSWVNNAVSSDLRKLLVEKGYSLIIDDILAMPLTFIMDFPDELSRKLIAESEEKIIEISSSIVNGKKTIVKVEFKSRLLNFIGKIENFASRLFGLELHAGTTCNSCGICWKNCPEKNIKSNSEGKPEFGFSCLMCMRCIYNCPQKAITPRFSKFIPIKNGYSITPYLQQK